MSRGGSRGRARHVGSCPLPHISLAMPLVTLNHKTSVTNRRTDDIHANARQAYISRQRSAKNCSAVVSTYLSMHKLFLVPSHTKRVSVNWILRADLARFEAVFLLRTNFWPEVLLIYQRLERSDVRQCGVRACLFTLPAGLASLYCTIGLSNSVCLLSLNTAHSTPAD